jgi:Ca-activated chloride channel family protein
MTTPANVREYLRQNNYPANVFLRVNKHNNTIRVNAPEAVLKKLEKLFNRLQQEERELKDLSNGLPFIKSSIRPVSTFSIDTDTASYVQARKCINRGERPDPLKIRPEEFINYFNYNYRSPHKTTFAVYLEAAPSPFRQQNTLFRIGIQGKRLGPGQLTRSHYVILLDTSGSMAVKDRMELGKKAVAMLLDKLKNSDYISLLVCGDKTRPVFSVKALTTANRKLLLDTLNAVSPHGTADFAAGISEAYKFAGKYFLPHYSNKVIIISDGIFELNDAGRRNIDKRIETARKRGISNIVIGLGGDGDDTTLEKVAAQGDGSYVFLDNEHEAKELFTSNFEARFREIARDVKIQVRFNPEAVKSYRQIGYKNRQLSKADFRNDKVDAGEVGSGQSVTALYELKLKPELADDMPAATVRIRYKRVDDLSVEEKAFNLYCGDIKEKFSAAAPSFKLASFVAEFAEALRYPETRNIASTHAIADELRKLWTKDYRKDVKVIELLKLIKRSK